MSKLKLIVTFTILLIVMAGCGGYANPNADESENETAANTMVDPAVASAETEYDEDVLVLRMGHQTPEETNYHKTSLRFKDLVEEKTNGKVRIDIFPFRQLGADRELIEAMQFGTLDLGMISGPPVSGFKPEAAVLDLPFLFEDWDHVNRFLESDLEEEYRELTEDVNLLNLGTMARGFRHVTSSTGPVTEPEDFKGLTLRVQESPVYIDAYNDLGSSPQSMGFGDAFTALEQGAIDGQENTMDINFDEKIFEVNEHVSKTGVNFVFAFLMASQDRFESWPEDVQQAIVDSAEQAVIEINKENEVNEAEYEKLLEAEGMEIHEVDRTLFRDMVSAVYDEWEDRHGGEMLQEILEMTE